MMKKYKKYKNTGIPWLGDIPEHWEVKKLKYFAKICNGRENRDVRDENGKYPIIGSGGVFGISNCYLYDRPSVLLGRKGTIDKPLFIDVPFWAVDTVYYTNIFSTTNHKFFYYLCITIDFNYYKYGSAVPSMTQETLSQILFPYPPLEEQKAIAHFLDKKTAEIDQLIAIKERLLELYKEEKTAIINQAVTKGINPNVKLKSSNIPWLGDIPEHWEIKKIKHYCYVKARIGWKGLKSSEFLTEGYAYLITGTDFKKDKIDWNNCYHIDKIRYEEDPYIQVINSDLLITKDGTIGKLAVVSDLYKPACLNSGIFVIRSLNKSLSTQYLFWVLKSMTFTQFNKYTASGSTIQHLYQNVFIEFAYSFPPLEEQKAIAHYIEKEITRIDNKIAKTKKIIELQKEYRTALISETVTGKIKVIE